MKHPRAMAALGLVVLVALIAVVVSQPFARRAEVPPAAEAWTAQAYSGGVARSLGRPDRVQQASAPVIEALAIPSAGELAAQTAAADTAHLLIRTGQVTIEVDSLNRAVAGVRQIAATIGGYVANANVESTEGVLRASLEVKIPAARFDLALERLRAIGRVERSSVDAQDVGEEYVDVGARMANAKRLEDRLLALLAGRTGRLQDVLEVERELARVREEIDRYAGRLQFLRQHAAVSTLTVNLHQPGTIMGREPARSVIAEAFRQAWRNFIWLIAFAVQALGVVLPLGVLALAGWALWRRFGRPRS